MNTHFLDIVMHEVDLKFGNKAVMLDDDSLERAE